MIQKEPFYFFEEQPVHRTQTMRDASSDYESILKTKIVLFNRKNRFGLPSKSRKESRFVIDEANRPDS